MRSAEGCRCPRITLAFISIIQRTSRFVWKGSTTSLSDIMLILVVYQDRCLVKAPKLCRDEPTTIVVSPVFGWQSSTMLASGNGEDSGPSVWKDIGVAKDELIQ